MECTITELCDHKLVRRRGDRTEVRYIKDQGLSSVSSRPSTVTFAISPW